MFNETRGFRTYLLHAVTEKILKRLNALLAQLSPDAATLTTQALRDIDSGSFILVAAANDNDEDVVGMLILTPVKLATGRKWWIDDVVVDEPFRGHGLGKLLMETAVKVVQMNGGGQMMLTSRPSRLAANRLYQSFGFQLKDTNVYTMNL